MPKTAVLTGIFVILLLATVLTACAAFEDPSQRATENAQNTEIWDRLYDFQEQMPTVEAMAQTADSAVFLATQLAQANSLNQSYRSTLTFMESNAGSFGSGAAPTAIGGGQSSGSFPTQVPNTSSNSVPPTQIAASSSIGENTGSSTGQTNQTTASGTRFTRSVTGSSRGDDNCAATLQNTFSTSASSIIFSSNVFGVVQGTAFGLRILSEDRVIASDPDFWIADDNYDDTCIWYEIDRNNMAFNPGTYIAQLTADNEVGATATFVITGTTASSSSSSTGGTVSGATFSQTRVGSALNNNSCVATPQQTFTQSTPEIYFSVVASNVTEGIDFGLRIMSQDDRIVASEPSFWVADDFYDETCLWYTIDRSVLVYDIGSYTVELLVDSEVAATTTFSIASGADTGTTDDMVE